MGVNFSLIALKKTPKLELEVVFKKLNLFPILNQEDIDFFDLDDLFWKIPYTERNIFFAVSCENNSILLTVFDIKHSIGDFNDILKISELLECSILLVEHSDTACVSSTIIINNGNLVSWDFGGEYDKKSAIPYNLPSMSGGEPIMGNGQVFTIITYFLEIDYFELFETHWEVYKGMKTPLLG